MVIASIVDVGKLMLTYVATAVKPYVTAHHYPTLEVPTLSQIMPTDVSVAPAPVMPTQLWVFRARLERVVDGDTADVTIDQGMHATRLERLRFLGVNTPETHGDTKEAGLDSKMFTYDWFKEANVHGVLWPLILVTEKTDVFGRYLAVVWRVSDGACLNYDLLAAHKAVVR